MDIGKRLFYKNLNSIYLYLFIIDIGNLNGNGNELGKKLDMNLESI